jgi:hypothetical protein
MLERCLAQLAGFEPRVGAFVHSDPTIPLPPLEVEGLPLGLQVIGFEGATQR